MARKATLVTTIVLILGSGVAFMRAEESSHDGDPHESRRQRSVLKRSYRGREAVPSSRVSSRVTNSTSSDSAGAIGTGVRPGGSVTRREIPRQEPLRQEPLRQEADRSAPSRVESSSRSQSPLVDRLKQIRGSVTGSDQSSSSLRADSPSRFQSEVPRRLERPSANEPRLLPGQLSRDAEGPSFEAPPIRRSYPAAGLADRSESARRERAFEAGPPAASLQTPTAPTSPGMIHNESVRDEAIDSASPRMEAQFEGPAPLITSEGPAIMVHTVGPPAITVGREAEYRIALTNQSRVGAQDVFVRIALPTWVEITAAEVTVGTTQIKPGQSSPQELIWKATQFGAGARELLSLRVIPQENRSFNLAVDWTLRPSISVAQIQVQQPELEMAVFGPDRIDYGETAVYTIQLSNPGTGQADDVVIDFGYGTEQLPPKRLGTLAAGESREVRVELSARQAGLLRVAGSAVAAGGLTAEFVKEVQVQRAQIEVAVIGSKLLFAGTASTYEFQVRNTGDADAVNVIVDVKLPPGAKHIGHDSVGRISNAITKQLGTISPGSGGRFSLTCQLTNPGENVIQAQVGAAGNLTAKDTFVTRVEAIADLKLIVNDSPGPIPINTDTVYELRIVNRGTRAAGDVKIVAQFSEGVEPVSASGATAKLVPGQVLFQSIPRIQPSEEIRLKITAKADEPGNHRFRAALTCSDPKGTELSQEESTYFFSEEISTANRSANESVR